MENGRHFSFVLNCDDLAGGAVLCDPVVSWF